MKRFHLNTGLLLASWALLLMFGCHKKRPPIPPEQEPPTLISQLPTEEPPATPPQNPPANPEPEAKQPEKPAHTPPRHHHPSTAPKKVAEPDRPAPTEEAKNVPPPRVTVQEGGATAGTGQGTTQQLLDSAENNLRNIKHQLSNNEQAMADQVRDYIDKSKKATTNGDNDGAHILALKARLLSDELVKGQ